MPTKIEWSKTARTNLADLIKFFITTTDRQTANFMGRRLAAAFDLLARNPLFGQIIPQTNSEFKAWNTIDGQYRIIFKRPNTNTLRMVMLQSAHEPMPTLAELRKANK
jgi:plasmid stabilization system protein ParE